MQRKQSLDLVAFASALMLTLALAFVVGWWYGLNWSVVNRFAVLYLSMFAMAVGIPCYYILRYVRSHGFLQG